MSRQRATYWLTDSPLSMGQMLNSARSMGVLSLRESGIIEPACGLAYYNKGGVDFGRRSHALRPAYFGVPGRGIGGCRRAGGAGVATVGGGEGAHPADGQDQRGSDGTTGGLDRESGATEPGRG